MPTHWSIPCALAYGGHIPTEVDAELLRLRRLVYEHCRGPYNAEDTRIGLAFFVDAKDPIRPMKRTGIRLEPLRNNSIAADIYLHESDWNIPLPQLRYSLWTSAHKALWTCLERLKAHGIELDEPRLDRQLSLVQSEFLPHHPQVIATHRQSTPMDETHEDEQQLVIQYPIGPITSSRDHDKRAAIEALLTDFLEESGLGYCDGGDIGSGTMNIFCVMKLQQDAAEKIINVLRQNQLLENAVIAEMSNGKQTVLWPQAYVGEFSLL